jgi:hypothetical protein
MNAYATAARAPNPMQRIRQLSRWMALACLVLIAVLPVDLVYYWASASPADLRSQGNLPMDAIQGPLAIWQRVAGAVVTGLPLAMLLVGVGQARQCFVQFARGQVFTVQAIAYLRKFAGWVAAAAVAAIIAGAVTSVLLTLNNPPGLRHLALGVSSNQVFTVFFAGLVWLMADVIGQGQLLAAENESFV